MTGKSILKSKYENKLILVLMSVVITALLVDTLLAKISNFISASLSWRMPVFMVIVAIYVAGQYFVLDSFRRKSKEIRMRKNLQLNLAYKIITVSQYILSAIILYVVLQMVLTSHYDVNAVSAAMTISYALAIGMMGLLSQRFFSWFRSNRNAVVMLYALSSTFLAINAAFTLFFVNSVLFFGPREVGPQLGSGSVPVIEPSSIIGILDNAYVITSIVSFMITWAATCMLLRHYSPILGKIKYWLIVAIPLIYFLSQFVGLGLNLFAPILRLDPIFFGILLTLLFSLSKAGGGILFGVAFWIIARNIQHDSIVKNYLSLAAYGLILLFVSNQGVVLLATPYPPFGVATISFVGLSSYLVLVGIYYSAISVAEDSNLRKSIRNYAMRNSKLLDSIGTAQMEQELTNRVLDFARDHSDMIAEQTGIEPSLSNEDIRVYLDQVIKEVKERKNK